MLIIKRCFFTVLALVGGIVASVLAGLGAGALGFEGLITPIVSVGGLVGIAWAVGYWQASAPGSPEE